LSQHQQQIGKDDTKPGSVPCRITRFLAFPLHARLGINLRADDLLYASFNAGAELFLGHWQNVHRHDPEEELCLNVMAAAGLYFFDRACIKTVDQWSSTCLAGRITVKNIQILGYSINSGYLYSPTPRPLWGVAEKRRRAGAVPGPRGLTLCKPAFAARG